METEMDTISNRHPIKDNSSSAAIWLASVFSKIILLFIVIFAWPTSIESLFNGINRVWIAAGEFRQAQWDKFLDIVGDDEEKLYVIGVEAIFLGVYWIFGGIFTLLDTSNKPDSVRKYKIQLGMNEPLMKRKIVQIIGLVLFNQLVVTIPLLIFASKAMTWRGTPDIRVLPPIYVSLIQLVISVFIAEITFYYSHRILHHRLFYKWIHKMHHEWTAPVSISAVYAHPLEHIVSNIFPPFLCVFLLGAHISTAFMWYTMCTMFTISEHSGYHIPYFISSERHDYHHYRFNDCYGFLGLMDGIHGTDTAFRQTIQYERHIILKDLKSAREVVPDPGDKTK